MSRPSVQATHLGLEAIKDGVVLLSGGEYRAVLEVDGVSFACLAPGDREALLASYAAFLNGLRFPVQLLVRITPADLDDYLEDLEQRARDELPDVLAALARDHAAFVRRLARRTLLERRCYLVVPAPPPPPFGRSGWFVLAGRHAAERERVWQAAAVAREQLAVRCREIADQLGRCGLSVRRLGDLELARLFHACWCPELARVQRLRRALDDYTAPVVCTDAGNGHERRVACRS